MDYMMSMVQTSEYLIKLGIPLIMGKSNNSCFVDFSRNTFASQFMESKCTHMMQIDDDMGWNPEAVLEMLLHDKEFIAGIGRKKTDFVEFAGTNYTDENGTIIGQPGTTEKDVLIKMKHIGAAFSLHKRSVFEKLIAKFPEYKCEATNGYSFYRCEYTERQWETEDYHFCSLCEKAGIEIWCYPNIDMSHQGRKDYRGNFFNHLKEKKEVLKYSIIIVGYKAQEDLDKCLHSLCEFAPVNAELIIVDNTPNALDIDKNVLRTKYKNVDIIWDGENYGFAEGCNIGVRLAKGENLVFVNPDTIVFKGWAEGLSKHLHANVGAVGPLSNFVAGYQNYSVFEHSNLKGSWDYVADKIRNCGFNTATDTKLLIGFFLMIPRRIWDEVGEFDSDLKLGCDDLDYSLRIRDKGYKLGIAPDVFVYHKGHQSFLSDFDMSYKMNKDSETALRKKLKLKYGNDLPTSTELWGFNILELTP